MPPVLKIGVSLLFFRGVLISWLYEPAEGMTSTCLIIFCCGADQGDSADIYLFNDLLFIIGCSNSFFKRIKINNHQVDGGDLIFLNILQYLQVGPAARGSSEYFGMQCFYPAAEDGRIGGDRFDSSGRDPSLLIR